VGLEIHCFSHSRLPGMPVGPFYRWRGRGIHDDAGTLRDVDRPIDLEK